jgi:glycosyltransferase involved in cell wall biosynthesis
LCSALSLDRQQVIVYAGSLALQNHPVNLLIDAFVYLQAYVQQQGIASHVRFTGHLPRSIVHTFLALGAVSVDPVQDDSVAQARSPLKIFESLYVGVPVVTADVGDRRLLLDDGRAGVLVAPGDPLALAQGILSVLRDPIFARGLAEAGRRHVQQHYTWPQLAACWETLYKVGAT